MTQELIEILKKIPLFSVLSQEELELLAHKFIMIELKEDQYLFHEHEEGRAFYVLYTGKLAVMRNHQDISEKIGYVRPGDVVGEMSLFTNKPRAADVVALYDSVLLKLGHEDFRKFCLQNPQFMWNISSVTAERAFENIQRFSKIKSEIVALVSVSGGELADRLIDEFKAHGAENDAIELVKHQKIQNDEQIHELYRKLSTPNRTIVYGLDPDAVKDNERLLKISDKVIILVDVNQDFHLVKRVIEESINAYTKHIEKELLLLHPDYQPIYKNTKGFLSLSDFSRHFHITFNEPATIKRVLRFMTGRMIGLVISGGAAKGWAAVGACKALTESEITIDYIGGTSMGAFAAAVFAVSKNIEEFLAISDYVESQTQNPFNLRNVSFPVVSLFSGKSQLIYEEVLKGAHIEDLAIPYFCLSANLCLYSEHIWDCGLLSDAVRASCSLPVIVPPFVKNHQIHVDGGVINNFPVDVLYNKLEQKGFIIGIDISSSSLDQKQYDFPHYLNFFEALKIKLCLSRYKKSYIRISETILRVISTNSIIRLFENTKYVDLLIKPDLENFLFSDFKKSHEMRQIGFDAATQSLNESEKLRQLLSRDRCNTKF